MILKKSIEKMRSRYRLINIDGNKNIEEVFQQIQTKIDDFLKSDNRDTVIK
jgi:hypothetical protein